MLKDISCYSKTTSVMYLWDTINLMNINENGEQLLSHFCSLSFIYQWFPILRDFLFSEYYGLISYSFVETACMYDNALIEQKITHGHAFWLFHCYKKYKRYFFQNNFLGIYLYT